jgi:beta-glucosidase
MKKLFFAVMLLLTALYGISNALVKGKAVNPNGQPVADAMVYYTSIANRLIYVYSNANGDFCLPSPSEWKVDDPPMYKSCATYVKEFSKSNKIVHAFNITLRGSTVLFNVFENSSKIKIDLYTLTGKFVTNIVNQKLDAGNYACNPFYKNKNAISNQIYIVRISDGTKTASIQIPYVKNNILNSPLQEKITSNSLNLKKILAIDQVRVGKTGFKPTIVDINSYDDNVGNVTITPINIEFKVDSILGLMNLNEKLGQMVQVSDAGLISSLYAGSFLKGSTYSAQQSLQQTATSTRMKIPVTIGTDYVHGGPKVYFPHNIGLGASGDTLLTELAYRITAMCCKVGNNVDFAPCIDLPRNDKYGRVYEGFSEVTADACKMARAAVRGLQGTDLSSDYTMIATAKHYAGAGGTQDGVMRGQANTGSWAVLCKLHLPQFRAAVEAGVASVMTSYNSFVTSATDNGQTNCTEHKILITDSLKNGWGFDGFTISDWMQVYAPTWNPPINRIAGAFNAGLDVSMSPQDANGLISNLKNLVPGTIPQSRVDDAVRRCLRVKLRMGLFEKPLPKQELQNYLDSPEYRSVARACVRKSLVLLKNQNNVLPLKKNGRIHVVGAWADNLGVQCGGWSETGGDAWQGSTVAHGIAGATTIYQAIQAVANANGGTVTYNSAATNIPTNADVIVVVVGETPYAEDAGYRSDITLASDQQNLVATCAASGKPVVTILLTGRPNCLGSIPNNSTALVAAWLPGTEGGGVADVLFGDYNFVGKLKFTWPATNSQEPINTGNEGDATGSGGTPLYPYGHGLTY